jgi:thiol peroxidase
VPGGNTLPIEREGIFEVGGKPATIIGRDITVGQSAPEFTITRLDWTPFKGLGDTQGKVRIIASMPSLDTSVCDRETRRFNMEASALDEDIVILIISTDLPYAQKRWCGAAGVDQVEVLSDHQTVYFAEKYGVLIKERRILRRAVFVVDREGKVVYVDYMPTQADEPDYDAVLAAARHALVN